MDHNDEYDASRDLLLSLTADIVAAYVGNNSIRPSDLPALITDVHAAFSRTEVRVEEVPVVEKPKPAVNPKKSVHDDYIICLEDGKKFKSLKRHLMTHFNLTPEQYREKWDLEPNYPMVAPNYAKARSNLAKKMGLGRKAKEA
ncbi:MucR family transcriptional regulator [Paenochrobactrum sp. BZR 588]|uniref:MucR family transcriptional regulator n=1 Tax=Paenochrobactrum TaxID=999488 RepID=UPI0035BC8AAB